jgi:hypothetical protein
MVKIDRPGMGGDEGCEDFDFEPEEEFEYDLPDEPAE